jgi:hypothetical protein
MRRFDMRLPASVRIAGDGTPEFFTETQNVSARGVFFYLDRLVDLGSRIDVTLTFPPHVTLTDPVRVRFAARVIRVENPLPSSRVGVAAMIEEYEFLKSNPTDEFVASLGRQ